MKSLIQFLCFLLLAQSGFAQKANLINDLNKVYELKNLEVLTDKSFSFKQVISDPHLRFTKTDSLKGAQVYWVKAIVTNPSHRTTYFNLKVYPNFDNTLYSYNATEKQWMAHNTRFNKKASALQLGGHPLEISGGRQDTFYVRIDTRTSEAVKDNFKARLVVRAQKLVEAENNKLFIAWILGLVVLALFFFNNLYIYSSFNDKSVGFYLIGQIGGMLYLTAYCHFFELIFPPYIFSFHLDDVIKFYGIDQLMMHLGIVIVFYGFVQLCRSYLNTKTALPLYDKILKYGLAAYIVLSIVLMIVNVAGIFVEEYTLMYDNVFCLLVLISIVVTSIKATLAKLPMAATFLIANLLPLLLMCLIPVVHIWINFQGSRATWLPVTAIMAQALSFSIALVARIKVMRETLAAKEMESRQLAFELKETAYKNQLKEKEIEHANASIEKHVYQNELLNDRVENHQRELAASALFMVQKNELFAQLKSQIGTLKNTGQHSNNLNEIDALIKNNEKIDDDWNKFKIHFEQVHPNFFSGLQLIHPNLTRYELRLCAYFHINMSTKEIATLLNIAPASVRQAKTRLNKKLTQYPPL